MKHNSHIYHEFSNVIATIDRYLHDLGQSLSDQGVTKNVHNCTKSIEKGVSKLKKLLSELRNRTQVEDRKIDALEASVWIGFLQGEVIPELVDLHQIEINLINEITPTCRTIMNLLAFRSICENLISNAVIAGADRIIINVKESEHAIDLIIRDNGNGMTEDEIRSLGLGYTKKSGKVHGQGIRLIRQLSADIAAVLREPKSIPGIGSEFQVSFLKVTFCLDQASN